VAGADRDGDTPLVGVLALQGDFEAHARVLQRLAAEPVLVRVPADLAGLQALVLPGGESTTMTLGVEREGLAEPLRRLGREGLPVLGSCAGLIMLDTDHLGLMDMRAQRNAFGRQIRSFQAPVEVSGIEGGPIEGAFIRAPQIAEHGPGVSIVATLDGHAVAARQDNMLAVAFHTELGGDVRLHAWLLARVAERAAGILADDARLSGE
jgi:5'-phosphate synthase pdxT subunit